MVSLQETTSIPDALECIAAADVFVSSESDVSQAAAVLSTGVKVRCVTIIVHRYVNCTC